MRSYRQSLVASLHCSQRIIRQRIWHCLCVLVTSLLTLATVHADNTAPAADNLLVLGDSLSAGYGIKVELGWVSLLQHKLDASHYPYRVVNASISGETSDGGLARLPVLLDQYHPALVVIELGANDGLRGFPIPLLRQHLDAMIDLSANHGAQVLLVAVQIPLNYGQRYTRLFNQCFIDTAQAHTIVLAPGLLGEVPLHDELMQKDGLHPLAEAQPQLLDHVWPYLQPLLKKQDKP